MIENEEVKAKLTFKDVNESKPKEMWKTKRFFRNEWVTSISKENSNSYVILKEPS